MWLTCKEKLDWNHEVEKAFQNLKITFVMALILVYLDFLKSFQMETNVSNFALEVVLLHFALRVGG